MDRRTEESKHAIPRQNTLQREKKSFYALFGKMPAYVSCMPKVVLFLSFVFNIWLGKNGMENDRIKRASKGTQAKLKNHFIFFGVEKYNKTNASRNELNIFYFRFDMMLIRLSRTFVAASNAVQPGVVVVVVDVIL